MVDRMMRAARADVTLYEEAEANPSLTQEAYTVVGVVAVISAIGGLLTAGLTGVNPIVNALWSGVSVFVGYLVWSYLTYFIGTRVFNGTADAGELQRTLGYAYTPQVLSFIPCVGFLAALWSLYLGIVAVRQALDFDTGKAVLTAGVAFVVWFVIAAIIGTVLGLGAAGLSAITGGS
jgi:hypothetical protein